MAEAKTVDVAVPDPGPYTAELLVALEEEIAELRASIAELQNAGGGSSSSSNVFEHRILMPYAYNDPYNELRWIDEYGNVTAQIVGHGWNQDHSEYHGHIAVYVVDDTDPSGNGRGEAIVFVNAVRDPNDEPAYQYDRKKIGLNHAILMLNDSIVAIRSSSGKLFGIHVDDAGKLFAKARKDLPKPTPIDGPL
jgi:hypothetical protein